MTGYSGTVLPPTSGPGRPARPAADRLALRLFAEVARRDPPGTATDNRYEQTRHFTGIVYLLVNAIASELRSATATAYRRKRARSRRVERQLKATASAIAPGEDEDLEPLPSDHPLTELYRKPAPDDFLGDLLTDWVQNQYLTGSAFVWPVIAETNRPCHLVTLPTAYMQAAVGLSNYYPRGAWRVTGGVAPLYAAFGAGMVLAREDVVLTQFRNPLFRWDGYSPLTAAGTEIDLHEQIIESRGSAMRTGVTPDLLVNAPGATQDALDKVDAQLRNSHGGSRNNRKLLAFDGDSLDIKQGNIAPKEMDYQSSYSQSAEFLCGVFRVPAIIVNLASGTYSERYAARQGWHEETLGGLCRVFSQHHTESVAKRFWGKDHEVHITLPGLESQDQRAAKEQRLDAAGARLVNDIRRAAKLPPVEDGDNPPEVYKAIRLAKAQAAMQPPPVVPGDPAADPGTNAPEGDDGQWQTEEEAQAGIAELAAGLLTDGDDPAEVKAAGDYHGEVKTDSAGRKYKVKDGKRVPVGVGGGGAAPKPAGGGLADVRAHIHAHGGNSDKAFGDLRAKMAAHMGKGGKVSLWSDGKQTPVARVENDRVYDHKNQQQGLLPLAMGLPGTKNGVEFHPLPGPPGVAGAGKPPPKPAEAGRPNAASGKPAAAAVPLPVARRVQQAAPQVAQRLDPAIAKPVLASVDQWADAMAAKHAPRIAAHLGLSEKDARKLLGQTIRLLCEHARKHGSAEGRLGTIKLGVKRKAGPPTRPANPAGQGSRPPTPKAMSAYDCGSGGALVADPPIPARRKKLTRRRRELMQLEAVLKAAADPEGDRVSDTLDGYAGTSPVAESGRRTGTTAPTHFRPKEEGGRENPYVGASPADGEAGWTDAPATSHVYRARLSLKKAGSAVFTSPHVYVQFRAKGGGGGDTYRYELSSNQIAQTIFDKIITSGHPYSECVKPFLRDAHVPYTRVGNG